MDHCDQWLLSGDRRLAAMRCPHDPNDNYIPLYSFDRNGVIERIRDVSGRAGGYPRNKSEFLGKMFGLVKMS